MGGGNIGSLSEKLWRLKEMEVMERVADFIA